MAGGEHLPKLPVTGARMASRETGCLDISLSYLLARGIELERLELAYWKDEETMC
jgi:hypothetical protein